MAVTINGSGVVDVGANASSSAYVRLYEDTDNGTNYVDLIAPSSIASNKTITLPDVTGTAVTTGDTGTVSQTMLASAVTPLGVGQTWQAVTRVSGTTYTNSTGRPIFVSFQITGTGANGGMTVAVNSVNQYTGSINTGNSGYMQGVYTFVVPSGATYTVTLVNASLTAYELR